MVLTAFACLHLANHLAAFASVATHISFMETARLFYRHRAVEIALLFCVACQIASGLWFVVRGWRRRRGVLPWIQAASGAYLAFFFLVHVGAVLFARSILDLDTNFYFAAAGFHVPPNQFFFAPYYFLAVLALFTHIGFAVYWQIPTASRNARALSIALPMLVGGVVSVLLVLSLAGMLRPVEIPAKYKATYERAVR
jgi:hypothetical protein